MMQRVGLLAQADVRDRRRARPVGAGAPAPARLARDRFGHVGDAGRAAPPPVLEGALLDRARPGGEARARAGRARQGRGVGAVPRRDPRRRDGAGRERGEDGVRAVVRQRNDEGLNADGLEGEEGTFTICSFWLVSCLARAGEVDRAQELFDQLASYATDLGLLAEEIDTANSEQLGNFPQAFSHIGLITAAYEIDKARGETA